jgi:superfamily II DNA or RNA helicase
MDEQVVALNEVPKSTPLALNEIDENLLFVLEDISEGPAKGKIEASISDFINLLELFRGREFFEGGRDGCLLIDDGTPVETVLHVSLDETTGELEVSIRVPDEEADVFVVSGGAGWVLCDGIFSKLKTILPAPMQSIYAAPIRIPREAVPAFLQEELPVLQHRMPVEANVSADLLELRPAKPRFILELSGTQTALSGTLYAEYETHRCIAGRTESGGRFALPADDDLLGFRVRNPDAEHAALEQLKEFGLRGHRGDLLTPIRGAREVLNFLGGALPRLRRRSWRVEFEADCMAAAFMEQVDSGMPVVQVQSAGTGFFEVGYEYETLGGQSLAESDIQRAINRGEAFVEKKGRTILLDIDAIQTAREVFSDCAIGEGSRPGTFRMNQVHAAYVESALGALDGIDVEADPAWRARAQTQNRARKLQPISLGDALEPILRDYQKQGVYWLRFLEEGALGGILADEMGLGKTLQTLAWLQLERAQEAARGKPALIICPTSLVENWAEEAARFTPQLRVLKLHGTERHTLWEDLAQTDLAITSYALVRRDLDRYLEHDFSAIILDEAQHIKNRTTQNAVAVKELRAFNKFVLTGTPIENSVTDLWSIMDFLMPGYLGNHKIFREKYERPIQAGGPDAEMAQMRLRRKLHPFLLRRLKKEVAKDLPEKIQRVAYCRLSKDQHLVYKQLLDRARKEVQSLVQSKGFNRSRMEVLKVLLQLRQACCHLDLLKLPDLNSQFPSAKMELFFELVNEALDAGHRILVFSQFTTMLGILREELQQRGLNHCYLDGATKDRQARVHQFNSDPSIPLFLISLKAGGSGLNLTGADMVIHFDPWWNPAVEDQATDRAHRIGQKKTVYSVKLITKNSVEEKVLQMQQRKKNIINATLEKEGEMLQSLSWEDIQDLLEIS